MIKKFDFQRIKPLSAGLAVLALTQLAPAYAQGNFDSVEISTTKLDDSAYMLRGAGGNLALFVGDDGAFLVDDQFAPLTEKIQAAIKKVSDKPVEFLVNTHWHGDHTGGNENFDGAGAHIVAHHNVRKRLKEGLTRAGGRTTPPAPEGALPVVTFGDEVVFHWNGRKIAARHVPSAHTDGDAIIFVDDDAIIHMGDVFFNGNFPFIDLESGGSLDGFIAALEAVLAVATEETKIVPGHGPLGSKTDLAASTAMLKKVRSKVKALVDRGMSEDDVVAAEPLKDLEEEWASNFIPAERMTRTAYRSLKAN